MSLLCQAPSTNRKLLHGRGFARLKGHLLNWTTPSHHCAGKICSSCAVGMSRPCITHIPTAFSFSLPSSSWYFTRRSHRTPHETGLSSEVIFLASIPEWQNSRRQLLELEYLCWSNWSCATRLQCAGSPLTAHSPAPRMCLVGPPSRKKKKTTQNQRSSCVQEEEERVYEP